jgi:hypothetical protein
MAPRVNWSISDQNVVVNYQGESHIVRRTDALADRLIRVIKENRLDEIPGLVSAAARIKTFSKGAFEVQNGRVIVNGVAAPEVLSNKIVRFSSEGLPFQPLLKFAAKLQENPSFRAVKELYQFLEKNDHPITESGNFIAYKRVRANFTDIHSGTFDNSVDTTVAVPRNQVDEDSSITCSYGLHVANWNYAHTQFSSHDADTDIMLEVEVNPADVVAIPGDYNQSKMRCCRYKVLGIVTTPFSPETSLRVIDEESFRRELEQDDLKEADSDSCIECGNEVYDGEELCSECKDDEDGGCEKCGGPCEVNSTICVDCEDEEFEEEEEEEEEDEDDVYPFEDEINY